MLRLLASALLLISVSYWSQAQSTSAEASSSSVPIYSADELATKVPAMARRDVGGGFWRTDGNFESVLRIKNVLETTELTVTPVLWMADGTESISLR